MLLQNTGNTTATSSPSLPIEPINLLLITLTLCISWYAYRTQRMSTKILDAKSYKLKGSGIQQTDFLIKNMSHTSSSVIRIKMRLYPPDKDYLIDMRDVCLSPEDSHIGLHYLYPSRSGTSKMPGLLFRVELGPLDFTRFRTVPSWFRTPEDTENDVFDINDLDEIEKARQFYERTLQVSKPDSDNDDIERIKPPYVIPKRIKRIRLEIQQTGEVYELLRDDDTSNDETEWRVISKTIHEVQIEGNEYVVGRQEYSPWNLYYKLRYIFRKETI